MKTWTVLTPATHGGWYYESWAWIDGGKPEDGSLDAWVPLDRGWRPFRAWAQWAGKRGERKTHD